MVVPRFLQPRNHSNSAFWLLFFLIVDTTGNLGIAQQVKPSGEAPASAQNEAARIKEFDQYIQEGRLDELEPLVNAHINQYSTSSRAYYVLGYVYYRQQKLGESIRALPRSLELNGKDAEAHYCLGRVFSAQEDYDKSKPEFEKAIQLNPQYAEGL